MFFLPSLLEYSKESLQEKLIITKANLEKFKNLQKSQNLQKSFFHLDFVLNEFAKDRKIMESLGLKDVVEVLKKYFVKENLDLSVHFMGSTSDLNSLTKVLAEFNFPKNWEITIFVPAKFVNYFGNNLKPNQKIGIWLDLEEWQNFDFRQNLDVKNYLLMTVKAGKSGQKLIPEIAKKTIEIAQNNVDLEFILDGGWSIEFKNSDKNVKIVSYSSFWKEFMQSLNKNMNQI
jgi:pentose-5-phosphate-3-epimerase